MSLYPKSILKLGVDGHVPNGVVTHDNCCTDKVCVSEAQMACTFIDLLPDGQLWDRQKMEVKARIADSGVVEGSDSTSMVSYAAYLGRVLTDIVNNGIAPSIYESDPFTASITIDSHLERLRWVDCYNSACSAAFLQESNPYSHLNDCNRWEYCASEFPEDFDRALKHGILVSLTRLNRGIIKNVDGINWVIEPLGARLEPVFTDEVQDFLDYNAANPLSLRGLGVNDDGCCWCTDAAYKIVSTSNTIPGAPTTDYCGTPPPPVAAEQLYTCEGQPDQLLFPGVLAAECIAQSLMPRPCPNLIVERETNLVPEG